MPSRSSHYDDSSLQWIEDHREGYLGPYMLSMTFHILLMGTLGAQCWDYYRFFPNDRWQYKTLVTFLLISGIWQSLCSFELLYYPFVSHYGDLNGWNITRWSWWQEPPSTSLIAAVCQSFFLHRCWSVTKNWYMLIVSILMIATSFASGIAVGVGVVQVKTFAGHALPPVHTPVYPWLAAATVVDVIIAVVLVMHLRKSSTGFHSTDAILQQLLKLTMETSGVSALIVTVNLIIFALNSDKDTAYMPFQVIVGKVYSNTVLYTLLSRIDLRQIVARANAQTTSGLDTRRGDRWGGGDTNMSVFTRGGIQIHTTTVVEQKEEGVAGENDKAAVAPFEFNQVGAVVTAEPRRMSWDDDASTAALRRRDVLVEQA